MQKIKDTDGNEQVRHDESISTQDSIPQCNLCNECQKISFIPRIETVCSCERVMCFCCKDKKYIGHLERIVGNTSCPGCRLISSCFSTYYGPSGKGFFTDSRVYVSRVWNFTKSLGISGAKLSKEKQNFISMLQIEVCSHEVEGGSTRTEHDFVGELIPAEDVDLRTSMGMNETFSKPATILDKRLMQFTSRKVEKHIPIDLLRSWINKCQSQHAGVCDRYATIPSDISETSIRLIDVQQRCLIPADLQSNHVALSYVWGKDTAPILTSTTLSMYSTPNGLTDSNNIPKTILDAMSLTSDLGQRYLWVDSACILQDDPCDKKSQLPIMEFIYNRASFVIIVASGRNASHGLAGVVTPRLAWNRPIESLQGSNFTTGLSHVSHLLNISNWNSRGWTFQESLLARRVLIVTEHQVYWNCHSAAWCEDRFTEFQDVQLPPSYRDSLYGPLRGFKCGSGIDEFVFGDPSCTLLVYCRKEEAFAMREFTDPDDALWAFFGVLRSFNSTFPKGFIWGLPYEGLDALLLWEEQCNKRTSAWHTVPEPGKGFRIMRFPSWTWFLKGCNVSYSSCGDYVESKVKWSDPVPYADELQHPCYCMTCNKQYSMPSIQKEISFSKWEVGARTTDFGLLHFEAQVATLKIHLARLRDHWWPLRCEHEGVKHVFARIETLDGQVVGLIEVPFSVFLQEPELQRDVNAEFVLLSVHKTAKDISGEVMYCSEEGEADKLHVPGCQFARNVNIMMVEWNNERKIAYRVAITRVSELNWANVKTELADIVLG
jgi:hypothetical protein